MAVVGVATGFFLTTWFCAIGATARFRRPTRKPASLSRGDEWMNRIFNGFSVWRFSAHPTATSAIEIADFRSALSLESAVEMAGFAPFSLVTDLGNDGCGGSCVTRPRFEAEELLPRKLLAVPPSAQPVRRVSFRRARSLKNEFRGASN